MKCGDPAQAGVLGATGGGRFCPRCESRERQEYRVRPDQEPTSHRRRCHDCGWDSGWIDYAEWIVLRGGPMDVAEAAGRRAARKYPETLRRLAQTSGPGWPD